MLFMSEVKEDRKIFGKDCITVLHLHDENHVVFVINVTLMGDDISNTHYLGGYVYQIDVHDTDKNPIIEYSDSHVYDFYSKFGDIQGSFCNDQDMLGNYADGSKNIGDMVTFLADITLPIDTLIDRLKAMQNKVLGYNSDDGMLNISMDKDEILKKIINLKILLVDNDSDKLHIKTMLRNLEIYIESVTLSFPHWENKHTDKENF